MRDCIILKAGVRKQERPYIAKVASFWQENGELSCLSANTYSILSKGSVMMTVFWYYRPEDIAGSDFHEVNHNKSFLYSSKICNINTTL